MGTTTYTIEKSDWAKALITECDHFVYPEKNIDRKTYRKHVDCFEVAKALAKHLPGKWTATASRHDEYGAKLPYSATLVRAEDGLNLYVGPSTNHGKEWAIAVSLNRYDDAHGHMIDVRYLEGRPESPSARCTVGKRGPSAIAKDIIRRVVQPSEAILPLIRERQKRSEDQVDAKNSLAKRLEAIEGVEVRPGWHNEKTLRVDCGPLSFQLTETGFVSDVRLSVDAADAEALCKALIKFKKR